MFGRGFGSEWLVVLLIVLLLFGASRLPRLARSLREARNEFQKGEAEEPEKPVTAAQPAENPPKASGATVERAPDQPPPDAT